LKSLGRSVGRRSRASIVNQVMKDKKMRKKVAIKIGKAIHRELVFTCSDKSNSLFGKKDSTDFETFQWSDLADDINRTMPMFFTILNNCLYSDPVKKNIAIAMLGGILIKSRNHKCNFLQRLFSVLLYASHCPKQVNCVIVMKL
jgi:hypothetical protein